MFRPFRSLSAIAVAVALLLAGVVAPASAAFNPTIVYQSVPGITGVGRFVFGTITLGASDTYVTGGITLTPSQLGGQVAISTFITDNPSPSYETAVASNVNGNIALTLQQPILGTSQILATATTATVTVAGATGPNVLTANTQIMCQLDDAATGGGGTGTWSTSAAVASCKYASATTFTITSTAAAPTNGGNFTYQIPGLYQQMTSGFNVAGAVIPFVAVVS